MKGIPVANAEEPQEVAAKKSKKPVMIGLVLALLLGCGGFYATWAGLILAPAPPHGADDETLGALPDIAFVPVEPLTISLGAVADNRHLRFSAQLEVAAAHTEDVTLLLPRIADVMNGYLRALDPVQFDDPVTLVRMRAQMLRRIQIVTGEGRVRDLLVTEFVLN